MDFTPHLRRIVDRIGEAATWTPAAGGGPFNFTAIYDEVYREVPLGEANQAGKELEISARNDELAQGSGIKRGDTVTYNGTNFKVGNLEAIAPGLTRITLRK
jgi:hypothetical protein